MIEIELNWEDPEGGESDLQKGVSFCELPRTGDEVIFDYGDGEPPHDGYRDGIVTSVTWWGDGKIWVNLKLENADPWPFKKRKADGEAHEVR